MRQLTTLLMLLFAFLVCSEPADSQDSAAKPTKSAEESDVTELIAGTVLSVSIRTTSGPKNLNNPAVDISEDPESTVIVTLADRPEQEFRIPVAEIVEQEDFEDLKGRHHMMSGLLILSDLQERMNGKGFILILKSIATGHEDGKAIFYVRELKVSGNDIPSGGDDFLETNRKRENVVALPSGLQYRIIKAGEGTRPLASDQVTIHYEGMLVDGTKFDSSYDRGKPVTLRLTEAIEGFNEALQLMKEGAKWEVFIPSELGYGDRATGVIPPNSVLIFKIELLAIEPSD